MYSQIDFKRYDSNNPTNNDSTLYFIDEDGDEAWESVSHVDGFGKLQHQLGVLAAIAYLDFNDFSK
jgi:hypothetical protein